MSPGHRLVTASASALPLNFPGMMTSVSSRSYGRQGVFEGGEPGRAIGGLGDQIAQALQLQDDGRADLRIVLDDEDALAAARQLRARHACASLA